MYLTYDEYVTMGGTLSKTAFDNVELDAEIIINWHTFNRLVDTTPVNAMVKSCVFKIIDFIVAEKNTITQDGGIAPIKSQENDGVKTQFETFTAPDLLVSANKEIYKTVDRYLNSVKDSKGRPVLYRGLYPNE